MKKIRNKSEKVKQHKLYAKVGKKRFDILLAKHNVKLINIENYKNVNTKLQLKCDCGNIFITSYNSCKKRTFICCQDCVSKARTNKSNEIGFDKYKEKLQKQNCVLLKYNGAGDLAKIKCKCNNIFYRKPCIWNQGFNFCKKCSPKLKGEEKIKDLLTKMKVNFIQEYRFKDCRNKLPLPFDFAIFKSNKLYCLIEYQGEQHYRNWTQYGDNSQLIKHDKIKKKYCMKNKINLYTIPHTKFDLLEEEINGIF